MAKSYARVDTTLLEAEIKNLRRLNEDLNNQINKMAARSAQAANLEFGIKATANCLQQFLQELRNRKQWAEEFVEEGVMPRPYLVAMSKIEGQFYELLLNFDARFRSIAHDTPASLANQDEEE